MNALSKPLTVLVGRRTYPFTTPAEISYAYRSAIDRLGLGGSQTPQCKIFDDAGELWGYVSYNGRVWQGKSFDAGAVCIYDPR